MSIRVLADDLASHIGNRPFAYLVSTGENGPKVVAQRVTLRGSRAHAPAVGRGTLANVVRDPRVTLVWPPATGDGEHDAYTLIADGVASVDGSDVVVEVSGAILHRPA